jgi:hypothetical protein
MQQDSPFADLIPGARPQPLTPIIPRTPAPHSEQTPDEAEIDRLRRRNLELENERNTRRAQDPAGDVGVEQRRSAGFYLRARDSDARFNSLGVQPRNPTAQYVADVAPQYIVNANTSTERQQAEALQRDFVAATLRYESGAAIPDAELEQQRRTFFPQPGDSPETIRLKARLRANAIESLRIGGGQAVNAVPAAPADDQPDPAARVGTAAASIGSDYAIDPRNAPGGSTLTFRDEPTPPGDVRTAGALAEEAQNMFDRGATREQLDAFASQRGLSPFGRELDAAIRFRDRGGRGARIIPNRPEVTRSPETERPGGPQAFGVSPAQLDALGRGAADILTAGGADEIAAAGDTIFNGDTYGENLWLQRGIDAYDERRHPFARMAGQAAGAMALPTGVGRAFETSAAAGARRMALEGGVYGTAYGFGSGEGDLGDRLSSAGVSGAFGALTGYGLGRGAGGIASRYRGAGEVPDRANQLRTARSAAELDIYMPRSVLGGEQAQRWATSVEKTPFGAAPMAAGTERMINTSQAARDRIAREAGQIVEPEAVGEMAQRGGEAVRKSASARGERLYGTAERLSGDARVPLPGATAELDRQIAELSDTPGVAPDMLAPFQGVRSRLEGEWTPAGIRRMRTQLERQFGSAGMQPGDASRRARLITEAAEEDMITGLTARGNHDAAQAWRAAADDWRQSRETLSSVVEPILGRNNDRTAEEVSRALMANAKGNGTRLGSFLREIPAEEAGSIRASIINQLGRSPPGQQNAAGEAFSLDTFLTHWNQIKGARHQIFPRETVTALNHLAEVADRARFAGRGRNMSNTGTPMMASKTVGPALYGAPISLGMGSPKLAAAAMLTSALAAVSQRMAGKLLASNSFAQRLAHTIENPSRARSIWSGPWVQKLARSEPAIAADLTGFQQAVLRQIGNDTSRAAAGEQEE